MQTPNHLSEKKRIPVWEFTMTFGDKELQVLTTTEQREIYYGGDWSESIEPVGYLLIDTEETPHE